MTHCTVTRDLFPRCKGRKIETNFDGGDITSDAGAILLRQIDRELNLTRSIARKITDPRNPFLCRHQAQTMIRQRVYGLALGYEDLNDHTTLRHDLALQTAVDSDATLASQSTLCRFELNANRSWAVAMHEELVEQFIRSYRKPPKRLILDFDATDDAVHGEQVGRHFNGYYNSYCFLPLFVFCGQKLLVSYLRPASVDAAKHAWAILALLVRRLRAEWPQAQIIFRGDSGFCRPRLLSWCERHGVDYVVGIGKNSRLDQLALDTRYRAAIACEATQEKQRCFATLWYSAHSWKKRVRKVIVKAEFTTLGDNNRYIVTSLSGSAKWLYDRRYCLRGDMENRIKEQQWLFSDRTSCHDWWPNQYRLLLSGLAYVLLERLRSGYLRGTRYARAQVTTLRTRLLKIGAVITRNTRRIRIMMNSTYPDQELFQKITAKMASG
ncbi:IS1380 family transposase [Nitrincola sp. MINF-07-Sa-05]|uniref:IS1380 family transposase n=1 Tax=Nitrincola salilacus TaxID=3400273 RepID=UPI003918486E